MESEHITQQDAKRRVSTAMKMLKNMVKNRDLLRKAVKLLEAKNVKLEKDEDVLIKILKRFNKEISHSSYSEVDYIKFYKRLEQVLQKWIFLENEKKVHAKKYWNVKTSTIKEICVGATLLVIVGLVSFFA